MITFSTAFWSYSDKNCDPEMHPNWKKSHDRVKSNSICISVFIMGTQSFFSEQLKCRLHVFLLNALVYISRVFSCIVIQHRNCSFLLVFRMYCPYSWPSSIFQYQIWSRMMCCPLISCFPSWAFLLGQFLSAFCLPLLWWFWGIQKSALATCFFKTRMNTLGCLISGIVSLWGYSTCWSPWLIWDIIWLTCYLILPQCKNWNFYSHNLYSNSWLIGW